MLGACKSVRTLVTAILTAGTLAVGLQAHGQGRPTETEVAVGTVSEITDQYVRIQEPGDTPHRHWFKWVGDRNAQPDKDMLAAVAKLRVGDKVEVKSFQNDLRRIESIRPFSPAMPSSAPKPAGPALPAPSGGASPAQSESATQVAPQPAAPTSPDLTIGDTVNAIIDDLLATGARLLELPVFMLLAGIGAVGAALVVAVSLLCRRGSRPRLRRGMLVTLAALAILTAVYIVDRKVAQLQSELADIRSRMTADAISRLSVPAASQPTGPRKTFLFDLQAGQEAVAASLGQVEVVPSIHDETMDLVQVHRSSPVAQAFLVIVDLRNPAVEIQLDTTIQAKRLTSDFARETDCMVAINGEAGVSPAPSSGLGDWTGHFVRRGQVLLQEKAKVQRPFLTFDRSNRATYTSASAAARTLPPETYNAIWGRWDALVDGQVPASDSTTRQPRTAMAISRDGTRLYLLVVDGRQSGYSSGFSKSDVGKLLKAFGAYNGMMCDEGGSTSMYLQKLGGVVNVPSDGRGRERPTYTHFGIAVR